MFATLKWSEGTKSSVFGTNTSENTLFSVPIPVPKQKHKNMLIKKHTILIKVKQKSMQFFVLI